MRSARPLDTSPWGSPGGSGSGSGLKSQRSTVADVLHSARMMCEDDVELCSTSHFSALPPNYNSRQAQTRTAPPISSHVQRKTFHLTPIESVPPPPALPRLRPKEVFATAADISVGSSLELSSGPHPPAPAPLVGKHSKRTSLPPPATVQVTTKSFKPTITIDRKGSVGTATDSGPSQHPNGDHPSNRAENSRYPIYATSSVSLRDVTEAADASLSPSNSSSTATSVARGERPAPPKGPSEPVTITRSVLEPSSTTIQPSPPRPILDRNQTNQGNPSLPESRLPLNTSDCGIPTAAPAVPPIPIPVPVPPRVQPMLQFHSSNSQALAPGSPQSARYVGEEARYPASPHSPSVHGNSIIYLSNRALSSRQTLVGDTPPTTVPGPQPPIPGPNQQPDGSWIFWQPLELVPRPVTASIHEQRFRVTTWLSDTMDAFPLPNSDLQSLLQDSPDSRNSPQSASARSLMSAFEGTLLAFPMDSSN
jgi:hypothetical protein